MQSEKRKSYNKPEPRKLNTEDVSFVWTTKYNMKFYIPCIGLSDTALTVFALHGFSIGDKYWIEAYGSSDTERIARIWWSKYWSTKKLHD